MPAPLDSAIYRISTSVAIAILTPDFVFAEKTYVLSLRSSHTIANVP
jgi:hypothetical protein